MKALIRRKWENVRDLVRNEPQVLRSGERLSSRDGRFRSGEIAPILSGQLLAMRIQRGGAAPLLVQILPRFWKIPVVAASLAVPEF